MVLFIDQQHNLNMRCTIQTLEEPPRRDQPPTKMLVPNMVRRFLCNLNCVASCYLIEGEIFPTNFGGEKVRKHCLQGSLTPEICSPSDLCPPDTTLL